MNHPLKYFENNKKNRIHKWMHYFEAQRFTFSRLVFITADLSLMWKHYFGNQTQVFGLDINPDCRQLEEDQIKILIGDQCDRGFLESLKEQLPRIDVLIDDGSHTM